jgi:hypothetical protein
MSAGVLYAATQATRHAFDTTKPAEFAEAFEIEWSWRGSGNRVRSAGRGGTASQKCYSYAILFLEYNLASRHKHRNRRLIKGHDT